MDELGGRSQEDKLRRRDKRSKIKKRSEEIDPGIEPRRVELEPLDQTWSARNKVLRIDPERVEPRCRLSFYPDYMLKFPNLYFRKVFCLCFLARLGLLFVYKRRLNL